MTDFRNFQGEARPLDDIDLPRLGHRLGVGEDEIHAVIDVEAAGGPWDARKRPKMLFEPHRFYRNLGPGEKRDRAVRHGLAYARWGEKPYPKDSYPRLVQAMAIDETAALMSASWGLGQILGENFAMVGYDTVQAMVLDTLDDADKHLEMMVNFILAAKLDDELRDHNWTGFARGYNGPQHAKHDYAGRLRRAYQRWAKIPDTPWSPETEIAHVPIPTSRPAPIVIEEAAMVEKPLTPIEQTNKANKGALATAVASGGPGIGLIYLWSLLPSFPQEWANDPQALIVIAGLSTTIFATAGAWIGAYRARDKRFQTEATG